MKLESLNIRTDYQGNYRSTIKFKGEFHNVELNFGEEISRRLLEVCADQVIEAGKATAANMTATVLEAVNGPLLTHDGGDAPEAA